MSTTGSAVQGKAALKNAPTASRMRASCDDRMAMIASAMNAASACGSVRKRSGASGVLRDQVIRRAMVPQAAEDKRDTLRVGVVAAIQIHGVTAVVAVVQVLQVAAAIVNVWLLRLRMVKVISRMISNPCPTTLRFARRRFLNRKNSANLSYI